MKKSRDKSTKLKQAFDSNWPPAPKSEGVRLSNDQVNLLIKQLREIAEANIELIAEAEAARDESDLVQKRTRILQRLVSFAFIVGCIIAAITYSTVRSAMKNIREEVKTTSSAFKLLDKNISLTLEVVRTLSDAQAAEMKANGATTPEVAHKARIAQRKATEAETKIQQDPVKKADAESRLRKLKAQDGD